MRDVMPLINDHDRVNRYAELFKALGDSTRVRILLCLKRTSLRVCDLAEILDMTHSAVSHQLRVLRTAALVRYRRCGREVCYSLNDQHIELILKTAGDHINE